MKRTAYLIKEINESGWVLSEEKITCEVYGEMDTGTKVWANAYDKHDKTQYGLLRMLGRNYFYIMAID